VKEPRTDQPIPAPDTGAGYERSDASPRLVALASAGLVVLLVALMSGMYGLFGLLRDARRAGADTDAPFAMRQPAPPEPRLQVDPAAELARLRDYERGMLNEYRWVDREEGLVAIPIDRAIDLLVTRDTLNQTGGNHASPK